MLNTKNTVANSIMLGSAQLTEDKVNLISELEARVKAQEAQMQRQYALSEYNNSFSVSGSALG